MTESYGLEQSNNESQPVTPSVEESAPQREERLFKQSEVNDIVKKAKLDAQRVASERPDYVQQKSQAHDSEHRYQAPTQYGQDDVRKIAAEEVSRLRDQWTEEAQRNHQAQEAQKIVQDFFSKMAVGKDRYDDFDQAVGDIDFRHFPNVVELLTKHIDNAADVMYSLGNDRIKMSNLEQLTRMSPADAKKEVQRLSQSIKDNQGARKARLPNEPLGQLKPSNTGTDTGRFEVSDYRKKYKV
jgi:hypothetical protein